MKLTVHRTDFGSKYTIGSLLLNDAFFCYTLEDKDRRLEDGGEKVYGQTAIPRGTYECIIDYSQRFNRELPRLLDVPQFAGIRIHPGNDATDTEGCILVGSTCGEGRVGNSRATFSKLFELMHEAYGRDERIVVEVL